MKRIYSEGGDELFTTKQVADLTGSHEATIRRWVSDGRATPYCEVGGTHLWREQDYTNVRKGKAGRPAK